MPSSLSFEQAATTPTVCLTVDAALRHAAACKPGDRALVHAAAGGVGLAALQHARMLGCVVLATAGSPAKRGMLRSNGVHSVANSRDTSFVTDLCQGHMGPTHVVLNSLTTPGAVAGSLAGVGVGGAFVEISKRDIWSPARLAQDRPDVHYTLLALDFLPASTLQAGLLQLSSALAHGSLQPLPQAVHDMDNSHAALRQMSQAKHVGKIVIRQGQNSLHERAEGISHGSFMVTGGLGSLGTAVAAWLTQMSISHVHVTGRSGKLTQDMTQALANRSHSLAQAELTVHMADASCAEDANALVARAPGLKGMIHASGVLADATFSNQSLASLRKVFAGKTSSGQKLHDSMHHSALGFETLFSSVTALLGGMGQANYAAANAALDSLAAQWQAQGSGGVGSIQWGGWAGGGMAGADPSTASRLARMGMPLINPHRGLAALGGVLRSSTLPAQLTMLPFDWPRFLASNGQAASAGIFDDFVSHVDSDLQHGKADPASLSQGDSSNTSSTRISVSKALSSLTPDQQLAHVTQQVVTAVRRVLGSAVSSSQPLMAAGLDSLGAVELKNALEAEVGMDLPSTLTFDYPTIDAIAQYINSSTAVTTAASTDTFPAGTHAQTMTAAPQPELSMHSMQGRHSMQGSASLVVVTGTASRSVRDAISSVQVMDSITAVPLSHWDAENPLGEGSGPSEMTTRFGGFLDQLDRFDSSLFGLSAHEALLMDPQQRMLLELTYQVRLAHHCSNC